MLRRSQTIVNLAGSGFPRRLVVAGALVLTRMLWRSQVVEVLIGEYFSQAYRGARRTAWHLQGPHVVVHISGAILASACRCSAYWQVWRSRALAALAASGISLRILWYIVVLVGSCGSGRVRLPSASGGHKHTGARGQIVLVAGVL